MHVLYLHRTAHEDFTDGVLTMPSGRELSVLERPWRNNKPFDSCIPDGVYLAEPYESPRFGSVYILSGGKVSKFKSSRHERYGILIHTANRASQLAGCLAPAMRIDSTGFAHQSRVAFNLIMDELDGQKAMIFISGVNDND